MIRLVVAEKPSVARDLARVLGVRGKAEGHLVGDGVWITWCVGHLVELCEPHEHDPAWRAWSAETLPMLPDAFRLRPVKSNAKQLRIVERLLRSREVGLVVNACDAGREGELIFRLVAEHAGCRKPVQRLWLSSLTDRAVREAFEALRPASETERLGEAARCRAEADWLVGLNATRALTVRARQGGGGELYTVGRVQTPTLAMIVRRDQEIEAFVPEAFWQVRAQLDSAAGGFAALWHRGKQDRLGTEDEARAIAEAVRGRDGVVVAAERKAVRERPPLLFDLTLLQREANRRFGMAASATLDAAQALYERHKLLTYPRTDSNHLTQDMVPKLPAIVEALAGEYGEHCARVLAHPLPVTRRLVDDGEVGDHHAIIPTGKSPAVDALSPADRRIFDLVARRFLAALHPDAVYAAAQLDVEVAGHRFGARGRTLLEAGWRAVEPPPRPRPGEAAEAALPKVEVGDPVTAREAEVRRGETEPPKRHTDASLLGAMERAGQELDAREPRRPPGDLDGAREAELRRVMKEAGLGTPATRAAIIEGLLHRGFVERQGKNLVATPLGRALIAAVPVEDLKSAALTGVWEQRLADVAAGRLARGDFMAAARELTRSVITAILQAPPPASTGEAAPRGKGGKAAWAKGGKRGKGRGKGRGAAAARARAPGAPGATAGSGVRRPADEGATAGSVRRPADSATSAAGRGVRKPSEAMGAKAGRSARRPADSGTSAAGRGVRRPADSGPSAAGRGVRRPADSGPSAAGRGVRRPAEAPPAARREASTTLPACPRCGEGTVIRGRRGWGCSRWREGCGFVVWFEQGGRELPEAEAVRLFRDGRTRLLDLADEAGAPLRGRVVLDLDAPGHARVEPSRRRTPRSVD